MQFRRSIIAAFSCLALFMFGGSARGQFPENLYQDLHWRMIGPFRAGRPPAAPGGASQPEVLYMAAGVAGRSSASSASSR